MPRQPQSALRSAARRQNSRGEPRRALQGRPKTRRQQLLRTATELFLAKGYEKVSVDSIIARTGGTKTNIYTHFGGKAGLFAAVTADLCQDAMHPFAGIATDGRTAEQVLRDFGRRFLTALLARRSIQQHRMLVSEAPRFPALGKLWFEAGPESARDALAGCLEQLPQPRWRDSIAPRRLAGLFLNMLTEEQLLRQLMTSAGQPSPREINRRVDEAVSVFLHGAMVPGRR